MKILYLRGYKWLLSQYQRVRNYAFGYRRYEALVEHIKPFLKNFNFLYSDKRVSSPLILMRNAPKTIHFLKLILTTGRNFHFFA